MNARETRHQGDTSWRTTDTHDAVIDWSVNPDQGLVQGPLDLGFLKGQRIALTLQAGQIALLIAKDGLQAIYLDGCHMLEIGTQRGQLPADGHLVFLDVSRGLNVRWTADEPVPAGDAGVIGNCTLNIAGPGRFFETFLAGVDEWDDDFIRRLVGQAARAAVERVLDGTATDPVHLQTRLANLDPADLDEELSPLGLGCCRTALYTSAPPVESGARDVTGQFEGVRHN
ncbi:MAG: hypothetical protein GY838_15925 [bacterium]|nr:hypothetical protein [bacterium]